MHESQFVPSFDDLSKVTCPICDGALSWWYDGSGSFTADHCTVQLQAVPSSYDVSIEDRDPDPEG